MFVTIVLLFLFFFFCAMSLFSAAHAVNDLSIFFFIVAGIFGMLAVVI